MPCDPFKQECSTDWRLIEAKMLAARWPELSNVLNGLRPMEDRKQPRILSYLAKCYLFMDDEGQFDWEAVNDRTGFIEELRSAISVSDGLEERTRLNERYGSIVTTEDKRNEYRIAEWEEGVTRHFPGLPNCNALIPLLLSHQSDKLSSLDTDLIAEGLKLRALYQPYSNLAPLSEAMNGELKKLHSTLFCSYGPNDPMRARHKADSDHYKEAITESLEAGTELERSLLVAASVVRAGIQLHPVVLWTLIEPLEAYLKEELRLARKATNRAFRIATKRVSETQKKLCRCFVLYHVHRWSKSRILYHLAEDSSSSAKWDDKCRKPWNKEFLGFLRKWTTFVPDAYGSGRTLNDLRRSIEGLFYVPNGAQTLPTMEELRNDCKQMQKEGGE